MIESYNKIMVVTALPEVEGSGSMTIKFLNGDIIVHQLKDFPFMLGDTVTIEAFNDGEAKGSHD
jgi:hypothetical protein